MITVNGEQVQHRQSMTLAAALDAVCVDMGAPMLITIDGKLADKANAKRIMLSDGAEIRVMPILSGG